MRKVSQKPAIFWAAGRSTGRPVRRRQLNPSPVFSSVLRVVGTLPHLLRGCRVRSHPHRSSGSPAARSGSVRLADVGQTGDHIGGPERGRGPPLGPSEIRLSELAQSPAAKDRRAIRRGAVARHRKPPQRLHTPEMRQLTLQTPCRACGTTRRPRSRPPAPSGSRRLFRIETLKRQQTL
jgi:hypothetical protein